MRWLARWRRPGAHADIATGEHADADADSAEHTDRDTHADCHAVQRGVPDGYDDEHANTHGDTDDYADAIEHSVANTHSLSQWHPGEPLQDSASPDRHGDGRAVTRIVDRC